MSRILIIDDDPVIRLILARALENQGYDVVVASDGETGITQADEMQPALIICDWMMPGVDGLEVCRHVKANSNLATTFFILLTSRGEVEDRVRGLDSGADDFLSKPIEMNELKARVRAGLRLYQVNQDLQTQKQLLEAELSEAAAYVRSLLPLPIHGSISIDSCFIPSRQLGGDCFDYFWLDDDHLALYLLDVSGHGLGAALPSISILNLVRSQSLPSVDFYSPGSVLKGLNETFQMSDHSDRYFTIWYGVYHQSQRQLIYASAGHPPAILVSGCSLESIQVQRLKTPGLPVGMFAEGEYINHCCDIPKRSTLYVFSDGVYELPQADGTTWSLDNFVDVLTQAQCEALITLDKTLATIQLVNEKDTFEDDLSLLQIYFD